MITNTILVKKNKELFRTVWRTIYQKENRCDQIQFLIEPELFGDSLANDFSCLMQVVLPVTDEEAGTQTTGKLKYLDIETDMYKEHYRMTLPITSVLTENTGTVELWFTFINDETNEIIKTSTTTFTVYPAVSDYSIDEDDGGFDVLAQIEKRLGTLEKSKADKIIYDKDKDTLQLYSEDSPLDIPIKLEDDVKWENWE